MCCARLRPAIGHRTRDLNRNPALGSLAGVEDSVVRIAPAVNSTGLCEGASESSFRASVVCLRLVC